MYSDEIEEKIERALDMFSCAFIHNSEELILHKKWNIYFRLPDIESGTHFDYKLLSYLSYYCASNHYKRNSAQCVWSWERLSRWFRCSFTYEDLQEIYTRIGCGANKTLGIRFIASGLNMEVLQEGRQE
jgi:hypothetical protein